MLEFKPEMIKSCVEKALNERYPNIKVYKDIQEGMENPCFYIGIIGVSQKKETLTTTKRTHTLCVQYRSTEKAVITDGVISDVFSILSTVHDESLTLKANSMSSSIENGVIQILIEYSIKLKRSYEDEIKMKKVKGKEGVKQ